MKLAEFKNYIDTAYERAGDTAEHVDVEFWLKGASEDDVFLEIDNIGQFGVVPDVCITLTPPKET